ncbi:hypothetical protein ACHHYP_03549 [Achlya hypogyna]|uniref:Uncharacterized protein n=1 Tax=Achlya hypogyna TaxID=1202772 RepID=A0A1V9ZR09_ACHHY|nr:hypothetical protein ACHHYP_03549 [Achlya hypogyna]
MLTRFQSSRLYDGVGIAYVGASVALGVVALVALQPYMANDYFWPSFFTSNVSTVLAYALNTHLTLLPVHQSTPTAVDLLAPAVSVYDDVGQIHAYARKIMYEEMTTLDAAVRGLRQLATTNVVYMVAQYCWVDFDRRWVMAHTARRLERCAARDITNGAVYMETVFRNIAFADWVESTQGMFYVRIGAAIVETSPIAGAQWLETMQTRTWSAVADEIRVWKAAGLERFVLQYANLYQIGIEESVTIENALGLKSTFQLKSIQSSHRDALWTTNYMFSGFRNDINAIGTNQSLVMNSSVFFGAIDAAQLEYYNIGYPMPLVFQAAHDALGWLANIDLRWVPLPDDLTSAVQAYRTAVLQALVTDAALASVLSTIPSVALHPTPPRWANASLNFYGGNPMCGFHSSRPFVQDAFSFDDACSTQEALVVAVTPLSAVFAVAMAPAGHDYCSLVEIAQRPLCASLVGSASAVADHLRPALASIRAPSVANLGISLLQFVQRGSSVAPLTLEVLPILDPSWAFFGWVTLYDWVLNEREVVSFEGDLASYTVLSSAKRGQPWLAPSSTKSLGMYMWYCAAVVSLCLVGIAVVLLLLFAVSRPRNSDWFVFNRVVSAVWSNRSLLLARALACSLGLATATVRVASDTALFRLEDPHHVFIISSLFASESVWITYVVQDVLTPLTLASTRVYAPWASHAAYITVLVLDLASPVDVTASLKRECYSVNMDRNIYCSSGSIVVGQLTRTITIVGINVGTVVAGIALEWLRKRPPTAVDEPSLLLSSAAMAYLTQLAPTARVWEGAMSNVTAFMAGVVHLSATYRFDIKLWRVLDARKYDAPTAASEHDRPLAAPSERMHSSYLWRVKGRYNWVVVAVGLGFMVFSLTSNILYLALAQSFLANDFGWEGFGATSVYAFVANQFNAQLLLTSAAAFPIASPAFADWTQRYNDSTAAIHASFHAPRRQLLNPSVPLATVVEGLRTLDPCKLPWVSTQYCWLDLDRTWAMASSARRQLRCEAFVANGAVVLETALRNLNDWGAWDACWGASFDVAFSRVLHTTAAGRRWWQLTTTVSSTVADEVRHWVAHGIASYSLQWQNYKTLGLTDTIEITSALGYTQPLQIQYSAGAYHFATQTSLRMYWTFASDLWAVATNATLIGGRSLLRGSADYAFANTTSQELLLQNLTLVSPLATGLDAFVAQVGPFGAVDTVYVSCPPELLALYGGFLQSLSRLLVESKQAQEAYDALPMWPFMLPVPAPLLADGTLLVGGNVMCGNDVPAYPAYYGAYRGFGMTNVCHAIFAENMAPSVMELLFAFFGLHSNNAANMVSLLDICALDAAGTNCTGVLGALSTYLDQESAASFDALKPLAHAVQVTVGQRLNVTLVQYVTYNNSPNADLFAAPLLDPFEVAWSYFGWCYLFEWVVGNREVVSFQGDAGVVTAISARAAPLTLTPDASAIPVTFSSLSQACNLYVSWVLICVSGCVALLIVSSPSRDIEGMNLFALNRIIGHVWAGRTFLIARSITAMWMLNTSPLTLTTAGQATHLESPALSWFMTVLASSEVSWLVYVLNDVLSCITQEYTVLYAGKSSLGTSIVVTIWTFLEPQHYTAEIDRRCTYIDMDYELVCRSGTVALGEPTRLGVLAGIAVANIAFWYLAVRWWRPHQPKVPIESLLLSAQSFYLMHWRDRQAQGVYYIDTTSAIMAGVVAVGYRGQRFLFDIKAWRVVVLPTTAAKAIPEGIPLTHF